MSLKSATFALSLGLAGACSGPAFGMFSGQSAEPSGSLGISLGLLPGLTIDSVNYRVEREDGSIQSRGAIEVAKRRHTAFVVDGLPSGKYTLGLDAVTGDPAKVCRSRAQFAIARTATATVAIRLSCAAVGDEAASNTERFVLGAEPLQARCAAVTSLTASPAETTVGSGVSLRAEGVSGAAAGTPVHVTWSVERGPGNGVLDQSASPTPTFTCTRPGAVTVSARAALEGQSDCLGSAVVHTVQCNADRSAANSGEGASPTTSAKAARSSTDSTCEKQQAACDEFLAAHHTELLNANEHCTATERMFFAKTSERQVEGTCLGCMLKSGCLDDTYVPLGAAANGGSQRECEDSNGADAARCLAALSCNLHVSSECPNQSEGASPVWNGATGQGIVNNAYCGMGASLESCLGTGPVGECASAMTAGFPSDAATSFVINHMTDLAHPAGTANKLVACALANCASACFP